ncbi:MAG: GTP-dependent dephospho-CoA kinase family protein [Methanosarcinales archaeon]
MWKIPPELRNKLKKPIGILYSDIKEVIDAINANKTENSKLIAVGDIITYNLIKHNILPDICIVDGMTKRVPVTNEIMSRTDHPSFKVISVNNPAGTITKQLVRAIDKALKCNQKIKIFVHGEEDLAALPAIWLAPINTIVVYGQPNEGVVLFQSTNYKKLKDIYIIPEDLLP